MPLFPDRFRRPDGAHGVGHTAKQPWVLRHFGAKIKATPPPLAVSRWTASALSESEPEAEPEAQARLQYLTPRLRFGLSFRAQARLQYLTPRLRFGLSFRLVSRAASRNRADSVYNNLGKPGGPTHYGKGFARLARV